MKTDGVRLAPDGPYEGRFRCGPLAAEGCVLGGRKHGRWRCCDVKTGGLKAEGEYDVFKGQWVWLRADGKKQQEGAFVDNLQHGEWTRWFEDGQMWDTGRYEMGRKAGLWRVFKRDGSVKSEKTYKA